MKLKTSKEPASISRAAVKAAVEAMYSKNTDIVNAMPTPQADIVVRVTKKTSEKSSKAKK